LLQFPFQFLVYYSGIFLCVGGSGQSVQEAMLVYPRGSFGNIACHLFAHLYLYISQAVSWCLAMQKPFCFLSVAWHGETLCWLGVQGVGVLTLLDGFYLATVAPES
jgi:hypothetical protein